jgi:alkylated DNA repair dioxygenase AlkB
MFSELFGSDEEVEVPGLVVHRAFLSPQQQQDVLKWVRDAYPSMLLGHALDQVVHFGRVPDSVMSCVPELPEWMTRREPTFNHMFINYYAAGKGIQPHVDLLRFDDGIVGISLLGPCDLLFHKLNHRVTSGEEMQRGRGERVRVPLQPGDVYILCGEARYAWSHEIPPVQQQRLSITVRRVLCD